MLILMMLMVSMLASSVVDRGLETTRMLILMMLMVSVLASSVVDRGLETTRMLILMMLMVSMLCLECGRSWVRANEDADSHDANG